MNILFLDFDGVLNSHDFALRKPGQGILGLDPIAVARLNALWRRAHADIVVSSSWRHSRSVAELSEILGRAGFDGFVLGKTPDYAMRENGSLWRGAMRGHEIQAWLNLAPLFGHTVDSFVILDDDSDMAHLAHRHVKTSVEHGLTEADVAKAVELFNTPEPAIVLADHVPVSINFTP